jgi:diguanylate cyclase
MLNFVNKPNETDPVDPDTPVSDPAYTAAQSLACKALLLADTYQTPPIPKAYEVWYSYASGIPESVANKINGIVEKTGSLDPYDLDQIHLECLSLPESERKHQDALSHYLDREMDGIMALVQSHLETSDSYSGSLTETAASLSPSSTPAQVRMAIELLLGENAKMRAETAKLNDSLEQSKAQVRKLRVSLERSREKAMRDPLTNLVNRRFFEVGLPREIAESRRNNTPLCLVMADIDHFKKLNDTYGHQVGDEVLKYFANLLEKNIRESDLAVRYGGEEFAIVLPSTNGDGAKAVIGKFMRALEEVNLVITGESRRIGHITASFGIARINAEDDANQLIARADAKLYEAKNAGRNRIACED